MKNRYGFTLMETMISIEGPSRINDQFDESGLTKLYEKTNGAGEAFEAGLNDFLLRQIVIDGQTMTVGEYYKAIRMPLTRDDPAYGNVGSYNYIDVMTDMLSRRGESNSTVYVPFTNMKGILYAKGDIILRPFDQANIGLEGTIFCHGKLDVSCTNALGIRYDTTLSPLQTALKASGLEGASLSELFYNKF